MDRQFVEIEGTWDEIAAEAPRFPGRRFRLIVLPETLPASQGVDDRSLEEKIAEITAQVPEEEWAKLPADLGDHLDHYIYGTPKRQ
jgi:hypothetical protein